MGRGVTGDIANRSVETWLVAWGLLGRPATLPWNMFVTIPEEAFVQQRGHQFTAFVPGTDLIAVIVWEPEGGEYWVAVTGGVRRVGRSTHRLENAYIDMGVMLADILEPT